MHHLVMPRSTRVNLAPATFLARVQRSLRQTPWREIMLRDPCVYCGAPAHGLDHIEPKSAGGTDDLANRAPACTACDGLKSNASLLIFLWSVREATARLAARRRTWPPEKYTYAWLCSIRHLVKSRRRIDRIGIVSAR